MKQYLKEIIYLLGEDRRKLPWLILLFLGSSLLDMIGIGLIGPYVAIVVDPSVLDGTLGNALAALGLPREQKTVLIVLGLVLLSVFVLKAVVAVGVHRAIILFSANHAARMKSSLMASYQQMPYTEFLRRNSSEYLHTVTDLTGDFAQVVQTALRTLSDSLVGIAILALLAWHNAPALLLLAGLLALTVYGYDRLFRQNLRSYGERANKAATRMVRGIHEGLEGLKEIRILGKEQHFHSMVRDGANEHAHLSTKKQVIAVLPRYLLETVMVVFVIAAIFFTLLVGGEISALVPTLGMFAIAALRLKPAAQSVSESLIHLRYYRNSVARLYRDSPKPVHTACMPVAVALPASAPEPFRTLTLERVTFTYPNATVPALADISMDIRAGETVGLIGPSGSGKTTLVDVLLGLLEPEAGRILYNGRPLDAALPEWRSQVAYLPQQVFLIDDTLRRNVALGEADESIDPNRIAEALRQARLTEVVRQLPDGVDTLLGERGVRLSGGQRQRVALARAFYHGRDVLVMDEATSALDNETEREIVEEIRLLTGQKTLIAIAHRLTTVRHCQRMYRLESGRVVEQGCHEEVVDPGVKAPSGATSPLATGR